MRTSRTDKGVHALAQVCSLKIRMVPDAATLLNEKLPDCIRVWDVFKSLNSFHAKNACESRVYEYFTPSFMFMNTDIDKLKTQLVNNESDIFTNNKSGIEKYTSEKKTPELISELYSYRISQEVLNSIREILKEFIGSNSYHSYTLKKPRGDLSAIRLVTKFECSDPLEKDGIEWLSFKVHGQSFMMHQIRKMMGKSSSFCLNQTHSFCLLFFFF